jgi:ribosomal protein L35
MKMPKMKTKSGVKKRFKLTANRQGEAWRRWQASPPDEP